tara:strand:+ start:191 stop:406 length:216 start_codon:yes stop_codon:yes gene_type:complete
MANVKLTFYGSEKSEFTKDTELECFLNTKNEITISIDDGHLGYPNIISLDKSTAIKLAKTIRTNINLIKEN